MTTPHPKARRGGQTWTRWALIDREGDVTFYEHKWDANYWASSDQGDRVIRVRITELRRAN
jgi:hypothetical protein